MKKRNLILSIFFAFLIAPAFANVQSTRIKAADLNRLSGAEWKGVLTYVDYRSGKRTPIASNLSVRPVAGDSLAWEFEFVYPDEPKANKRSVAKLSADGRTYDGETVIEKTKLKNGSLKIVTSQPGTDNDKKATFRYTYLISGSAFSIKKEVRYDDAKDYFERNEYSWKR